MSSDGIDPNTDILSCVKKCDFLLIDEGLIYRIRQYCMGSTEPAPVLRSQQITKFISMYVVRIKKKVLPRKEIDTALRYTIEPPPPVHFNARARIWPYSR